jgi:DNA adenine methylase
LNELTALLMSMNSAEEVRERYLKMPFSYPGSKGDHLDKLLPHIPYGSGFGEAFGGTGIVLLNRERSKLEVLNDRYSGITDFFRVVRDPLTYQKFMERIALTIHSREEFIWCKTTWKDCEDPVERAARWYYTIRYAMNGKPNSTFGRSKSASVRFADRLHKSLPLFGPLHSRLYTVTMENLDWRLCLADYDAPGFVWYLDPTYLDCLSGNYEYEMCSDDHKELICRIPHLKGFVAVSAFDGPQTRAIYNVPGVWNEVIEWDRVTSAKPRAFTETNSQIESDTRYKVKELLYIRKAQ